MRNALHANAHTVSLCAATLVRVLRELLSAHTGM